MAPQTNINLVGSEGKHLTHILPEHSDKSCTIALILPVASQQQ